MKKIYSILTSLLLLTVLSTSIKAQCAYNNANWTTYSAPTVIGASVGTDDCIYAGEYNRITGLQAGSTYRISTCSNSFVPDTRLTVYAQGGVGGALAFNDDYCGLLSRLDFTPTTTGSYDILVDATGPNNTCVSVAECVELVITLIGTSSSTAYCIPTYTTGTSGGDFINGVSLGSINNQNTGSVSGAAYSDFTNLSTSLSPSTSYTLAIKNNPNYSELVSAWIDYNQDFEFSEDERLGQIGIIANATGNINFTTPVSPLSGNTRMRVRMVFSVPVSGGSVDPCLASSYGETEDYIVSFPSDPPGPPAGLTFSTSCGLSTSIQDNACPNYTSASISVSGLTSLGTTHILSSAAIIIEHPMAADLDLYLESPSGQQVLLTSDNGGSGSDYGVYSSSSCTQVSRFIMNAPSSITSGTAPFLGSYIPEGNLADFNAGTNPNGLWKLKACDDMSGDIGTIRYFEIAFELTATEVPACADAYGIVDGSTNIELIQDLSWTAGSGNPTTYDVYFGADASSLVLVSDNQTSTTYSPSNLAASTSYSYKIVPANNLGDAVGCPVVTFTTVADGSVVIIQGNGSVTACSGNFFDSGGVSGNYSNSENSTLTIYPATIGSAVQVNFSSFELDNSFDFLAIVDGVDEYGPILGIFSGSNSPGIITATNSTGALTFLFASDDVGNFNGWSASISCVPLGSIPTCASNLSPVDASTSASVNSQISWDAVSGAAGYDVYFGTSASPSIVASDISATTFDPGALLNSTTYYYNVVPINSNGAATDCPILSFTTAATPGQVILMQNGTITTCDAAFFDSGNSSADYSNDESYILTLLPATPNSAVQVVFNSFDSESNFDLLNVYNGADASGSLVQSLSGSISQPISITSTSADGALTFVFSSDFQVASSGWDASVSCAELVLTPTCVTLNTPADASTNVALDATLSWTAGTGATPDSYDVYFGTDVNPLNNTAVNQTSTSFSPSNLLNSTTYYWSVIAMNAAGEATNCSSSSFTTVDLALEAPSCVTLNTPADASVWVALDAILSWTAGTGATPDSYDVYFGTDADPLNNTAVNQTATSYSPSNLLNNTTYYWSVIAMNAAGEATNCSSNSFTTVDLPLEAPSCVTVNSPSDAAIGVAIDASLSWTAGAGSTPDSYDVYFGTDVNPLNNTAVNQTSTTYFPSNLLNNTTYYWSAIAINTAGEATNCSSYSFTTVDLAVDAPSCVILDSPADASTDVALDASLSWTAGTGAAADSYDIYFGTAANALVIVANDQPGTSFLPTLNYATTYFWSVTANNAGGSSTNCAVNSFTTAAEVILPPTCVTSTNPADASVGIALDATLSWTAGIGSTPDSYNVYFGTDALNLVLVSESQVASSYSPIGLINNSTYYWSVVAMNTAGESTNCATYSFTTVDLAIEAPSCVTLDAPADASTNVALDVTLSWAAGSGATADSYDVYFGTDANPLNNTAVNQTPTSYSPSNLLNSTTYYWSVIARNAGGEAINCSSYSFTTVDLAVVAPSCVTVNSPADAAIDIALNASLSWTAGTGATPTSYDVYFGTDVNPLNNTAVNQTATTYAPSNLLNGTTYYWSVIAINAGGEATNCSVNSFTTIDIVPVDEILMQNGTLTLCSGNFFDTGGSASDYLSAEDLTLTILPSTPGSVLQVTFTNFNVEENYDYLNIYDGNSLAANQIGSFTGLVGPGVVTSTAADGSLTFNFTSDLSFTELGWEASISCIDPNVAPSCASNLSPSNAASGISVAPSLSWSNGGGVVTDYDVYFGTAADALVLVSDNQTGTSFSPGALALNTTYFWQVVPSNGPLPASNCNVSSFTTEAVANIVMQNGSLTVCDANFFDSGNSTADYSNDENYTLTLNPATPGFVIEVNFSAFETEDFYDSLYIYDGNSASANLIGAYSGTTSPGTVQSTSSDGSLTFVFVSDVSGTYSGWAATVNCINPEAAPNCTVNSQPADASIDNSSSNTTLSWISGGGATSYDVYFGNSATTMVLVSNDQTATSWTPPSMTTSTTYYWTVVANNASGSSVGCDTLSFTTASQVIYCVAEHIGTFSPLDCSNAGQEYINSATIGSIVNASGCTPEPAYSDFTSLSTTAIQGNTVPVSFAIGNYFTTDRIIIWGDWNQDGDFIDAGEQCFNSTLPGATVISGNLVVPAGASLGATRLRVRLFYATPTSFDPCGSPSNSYGESEDYTIVVEALAEAPLCSTNPVPADAAIDVSANQSVLSWTDGGGSATYDVYFGTASGSLVLVSDDQVGTSFDPGTLDLNTTYYWQIVPTNSIGTNNACLETSFTTGGNVDVIMSNGSVTTCGANFYDSGNSTGNYQNNENYTLTFFPDQPGNSIQVVFNSFNTELNYDGLYVYNGPDINSPLIPSANAATFALPLAGAWQGTNIALGPFVSSDPSGAITFVFRSDGSVLRAGWNASVSCIDATQLPTCATITSGPADGEFGICVNEAVFTWSSGLGAPATSYDVYFDAGTGPILISDNQTTTSFDVGILDTNTTYTIQIVPSNANGEAVGCESITFTTGTCLNYCDAGATVCDEYIGDVQMGNINNPTDCTTGGYNDYTALSADVYVGTPSPITVSNGPVTYTADQCGIWVDWNHDGDFYDANEAIAVTGTPGVGPYTALINAPVDAFIGTTTMRVRVTFTGIVDPCGTTFYGEVEDYSINVFGPLACPFPNNITTSETTTTNTVLTWDEVTSALEYQIRYRTATEPTTVATWSTPLVVTAPLTFSFLENLIVCEDYILQIGSVCELGTAATFSSNILFGTRCIECTSDLTAEGEDCGQDLNGGCNSGVFGTIACGETICGTSYYDGTTRDTDWFSFDVATDGLYTVNVLAEFDGTVLFANTADCNNILTPGQGNFFAGEALTLSTSLTAGTYSVILVPSFDQSAFTCIDFNAYTLSLSSGDTQIAPVADVCETAAPFDLFATPVGGIWTGTGVSATGTFDPSISGIGSFDLTYEAVGTGCSSTASITVNVIAAPVVDFVGLAASYCSSVESVVLTGIPAGGTFSINSSTAGAMNGNVFNPSVLDAGSYDITYIANAGGSCAGTITQSVIITDGPVATIDNLASATCAQDAVITLTGTPANGVFSGNGVVGSTFDPSVSGTGPQTITYTISEAGNVCPGIATAVIQVNPSPVVTLSGVSGDYCLNSGLITMIGTPALGSFLVDGFAANSTFDVVDAGLGSHVLRYEFNNGTCTGFSEVTINVVENLTVTFNSVPSPICSSSDPIVLTSTPDGAVFSGPGVVGVNTFDPSQAGIGTHTLTATYTNGNCSATSTQSVTVSPAPTASFNYGANGATVTFTNSSTNATSYTWDFGDGSALSTEVNPSHTYTTNGSFTIVLTATTPNCGSSTFTAQLDLSVGIGSIDGVDMIQLYPNPTSGNVTLAFNSLNQQSFNVRITDATGRLIQTESMTNYIGKFNKTFDLSESAKGVYLFTVASEKGSINFRVVRD